jgi:hypothetical protein
MKRFNSFLRRIYFLIINCKKVLKSYTIKIILLPFAILFLVHRIILYFFKSKNSLPPIVINTNINYSERTIPAIISQLKKFKIDLRTVYVIEGGHQNNIQNFDKEYNYLLVNNNSFDFTGFFGLIENNIDLNGVFLYLHDTVEFTFLFNIIFKTNPYKKYSCFDVVPLRKSPSMNIGYYDFHFVKSLVDDFKIMRNSDYSKEALLVNKHLGVINEDRLFKLAKKCILLNPLLAKYEFSKNVNYNGKFRRKEFYPQLGLIKYKANHNISGNYKIEL